MQHGTLTIIILTIFLSKKGPIVAPLWAFPSPLNLQFFTSPLHTGNLSTYCRWTFFREFRGTTRENLQRQSQTMSHGAVSSQLQPNLGNEAWKFANGRRVGQLGRLGQNQMLCQCGKCVSVCIVRTLQTCSPLSFNMRVGGFQGSISSFLKVRGFQCLQPFQIPKYSQHKHWLTEKQSEPIIPLAWLFNGVWQPSLFSLVPHEIHKTLALKQVSRQFEGGVNFLSAIIATQVQPIKLWAVASFHWQWLNHNILSVDMLSHGILLWPIAKQPGYLWLSLIGWSLSTKLKGHIPGTQPEAKTWQQFVCVLLYTPPSL